MVLRDYQEEISAKSTDILKKLNIVYLAMEVRTGKTGTALNTAKLGGYKNVLFLTKKKAISSILSDYKGFGFESYFKLTVINDESVHTIGENDFDLVIHDEHHRFGAFPKPGIGTRNFKKRFSHLPMIFLSGTIHPESFSQVYHQFYVSDYSPFKLYTNFYKWAKDFVHVTQRNLGYATVNDYSKANQKLIYEYIGKYIITHTQEDAGFTTNVNEHILYCDMKPNTYELTRRLMRDLVIEGKDEVILADTAVKLQQKLHQMFSGTIKFESGNSQVLDYSKAEFIKAHFQGKKIGIFYKFKAEWDMLKEVFGNNLTNDLEDFNSTDKNIALQVVSGREGISLKEADYLVFINIDFSAVSYWQSRDRLTTMERKNNDIYWVFSRNGIEDKIYEAVSNKKNYTTSVFKMNYGIKSTRKAHQRV